MQRKYFLLFIALLINAISYATKLKYEFHYGRAQGPEYVFHECEELGLLPIDQSGSVRPVIIIQKTDAHKYSLRYVGIHPEQKHLELRNTDDPSDYPNNPTLSTVSENCIVKNSSDVTNGATKIEDLNYLTNIIVTLNEDELKQLQGAQKGIITMDELRKYKNNKIYKRLQSKFPSIYLNHYLPRYLLLIAGTLSVLATAATYYYLDKKYYYRKPIALGIGIATFIATYVTMNAIQE